MKIKIDISSNDVLTALLRFIETEFDMSINGDTPCQLVIETKSKQNYKAEWEQAEFRASVIREK